MCAAATNRPQAGRWGLLMTLAMLAAVVWLLPGIIAHTRLLGWAINLATADLNGAVTVRSASLGWCSPIVVEGVEVRDAQGKTVLVLPRANSDRLSGHSCGITPTLAASPYLSPAVSVVISDTGSNVEDLLAKILRKTAAPGEVDDQHRTVAYGDRWPSLGCRPTYRPELANREADGGVRHVGRRGRD